MIPSPTFALEFSELDWLGKMKEASIMGVKI